MAAPEVGGGQGGHKQLFRLPVVRGSGSEHHKDTMSRDFLNKNAVQSSVYTKSEAEEHKETVLRELGGK